MNEKNYIFVDLSYYVFYRYFALINHYKISKKELPDDIIIDVDFVSKFDDVFEKNLIKLIKKYGNIKKISSICNNKLYIIFGKDCCRESIWRNELTTDYKATRICSSIFDGRIFEHVYKDLIPKLCEKYKFLYVVENCNTEADDVIGILCKTLFMKNEKNIIIITNDNDYLQLLDYVKGIYNLKGLNLSERTLNNVPSFYNSLLKALIGDISDNIKGVCSKRNAMTLLEELKTNCMNQNEEKCSEYIKDRLKSNIKQNFDLNIKLISFSYIPLNIQKSIISTYSNIL